jgi:hypothetical protein
LAGPPCGRRGPVLLATHHSNVDGERLVAVRLVLEAGTDEGAQLGFVSPAGGEPARSPGWCRWPIVGLKVLPYYLLLRPCALA